MKQQINNTIKAAKRYATIAALVLNVLAIGGVFAGVYGHATGYVKFDTTPVPQILTARQQLAQQSTIPSDAIFAELPTGAKQAFASAASPVKAIKQVAAARQASDVPARSPIAQVR